MHMQYYAVSQIVMLYIDTGFMVMNREIDTHNKHTHYLIKLSLSVSMNTDKTWTIEVERVLLLKREA